MHHQKANQYANGNHHRDDWDEVHTQLLAIQKKSLEVSNPDDASEKEADEVAGKVMSGESVAIHGNNGTINRKGEGAAETTPGFQSQLESSKGGGQSLDTSTRSDLESKMGGDFSGVKIHTGSEAHAMNESVNAKAFTHGQDIFFREGEFNPASAQGKELLAHELTHTVQQNNASGIQRKIGDDYLIKGKSAAAGNFSNIMFFDHGSSTLDDQEREKAGALKDTYTGKLTVIGYASEEGDAKNNLRIATARAEATRKALEKSGYPGGIDIIAQPEKGGGRIDYRKLRAAEILQEGQESVYISCKADEKIDNAKLEEAFVQAVADARNLIDKTTNALSPLKDDVSSLFVNIFRDAGQAEEVKRRLGLVKNHIDKDVMSNHECADECDASCKIAIAYNAGVGEDAMMTICPSFLTKDPAERALTIIHEATHGTAGLGSGITAMSDGSDDVAYETQRYFLYMSAEESISNADSYFAFIKNLDAPNSAVLGPAAEKKDELVGLSIDQQNMMSKVLAFAESRIKNHYIPLSSLYADINGYVTGTSPYFGMSASSDTLFKLNKAGFDVHDPNKQKAGEYATHDDQVKVAGINDRFGKIDRVFWNKKITIEFQKDQEKPVAWETGPLRKGYVNEAFFKLSFEEQEKELIKAVFAANPEISSGMLDKYVNYCYIPI